MNLNNINEIVGKITCLAIDDAYKIASDLTLIRQFVEQGYSRAEDFVLIEIQKRLKEDLAEIYETE